MNTFSASTDLNRNRFLFQCIVRNNTYVVYNELELTGILKTLQ